MTQTLTDEEIVKRWLKIGRLAGRKGGLGPRLAILEADLLESQGVTKEDIDRLFPD